nr:snRNA-activating protein complex subunit 4-like [Misgurnus anguillicaudatus]XP_055073766.1 snRNA-activating protein complex subunit 4-like [Misgurnus anguillicaudatus]XP_055073767.1 snRNA-activating protein complex subunit 4-like [Misgurnus anguillicaudatus]
MASNDLLVERDKIQREIFALENSLLADGGNITDLLSLDASSDDESVDSGPAVDEVVHDDLETERQRIQREIEELENTLGVNAELFDIEAGESEHDSDFSNEDRVELNLPQNIDTCLQINLVYQEVLKEKLSELEKLLRDNQQQQKEIECQLSGPTTCSSSSPGGLPIQKLFLGYFMKPYFKDKLTGLGPPPNDETKERLSHGTRPICEVKIRRWEVWQKALLTNAVATDTMKQMLKPKLSKLDYLSGKMSKANDEEKEEMKKQIDLIQQDIAEISVMREEQLLGDRNDDHDWEKISNVDFEGLRHADDLKRFWQNYLHPSINKTVWKQEEIDKLGEIVQEYNCCHWDEIAEALGTKRTAFMCFQTYQRYISKTFRRREWTSEEDEILRELVNKMRVGNFIPYMQMSYFMMGRDASQLSYRWTSALDPSIKKGPWSKEEDQLLRNAVAKYGAKEWGKIRAEVPGRTDGACRDRYLDCLQENVKKGAWSKEEVELLKEKVEKYGVGKWTKIASEIPNRVDAQCLNKWKQLTQPNLGSSRKRKRVRKVKLIVKQETKRRKVTQKKMKDIEITSSSEDEKQVKVEYMDSDAEADVPSDEDLPQETQVKDYIQPDIKDWIPLNTNPTVCPVGTVRTIWVSLSTNVDDLKEPNKPTISGRSRSKNSICPSVKPIPVRNTSLDYFGNVERTYVGIDTNVLLNPADNEKTLIKVPVNDVKHLMQWKATSVNKKDRRKFPEDKKKRRRAQNWSSVNCELLKAITPWIGNVILPVEANKKKLCEADIIGTKAAEIPLLKTPVFSFFIKALHIDAEGCKNVIKVRQKRRLRMPGSEAKPKTVLPNTVLATLQERKCMKNVSKEHAGLLQHPPSLPSVHPQEMTTPASIYPSSIVIAQPNMQGTEQTLLLNGQKISVLPKSPPRAILLPLIQLAAPVQPVTTTTSRSPKRVTQRQCKPTKKAQALMEEAKAKSCKKETLKQVWANKSTGLSTVQFQTQPVNWIFTPGTSIQVTEMRSANFPGNQMLIMPKNSPINASTLPGTLTNLCLNPLPNPCITGSSISNPSFLKPSTSINTTSACIQTPLTNTSVENKTMHSSALQMSPQASLTVHQKDLIVHTESLGPTVSSNNSGVDLPPSSSSKGTTSLGQHLSSVLSSYSSAATNVFNLVPSSSDLNVPGLVSAPVVSKPQVVSKSICAPTTIQQSGVIQQQSTSLHHVSQSTVPQVGKPSEPSISNPDLPSDTLTFDTNFIFLDHQSEVNDWMNGNGGISLPHLDITLPYLPPSAASVKKLTSLLKAKQSLLTAAAHILPHDYQNVKGEKEQEEAIRKLISERFATNPAYLWLKARFLSCFTLPALLATINPYKDDQVVDKHVGENNEAPAARTDLTTNENEALETQFSGIYTNRQCS